MWTKYPPITNLTEIMSFGSRATGGLMMNVKIMFGLVVFGELLQPVAVGFRDIGTS